MESIKRSFNSILRADCVYCTRWIFLSNYHGSLIQKSKKEKRKNEIHEKYQIAAASTYSAAQHDIFILPISQMSKNLTALTFMEME